MPLSYTKPAERTWRCVLDQLLTLVDERLNRQVNIIIHHPEFQEMEARWRGLAMLVACSANSTDIRIKVLSASWKELERSMERASDFDQSHLFELVYNREFGMPGGEPFGLLIGDYYLSGRADAEAGDSISTLHAIATTAAAAFCPFVAGVSAHHLGLDSFADLERVQDIQPAGQDENMFRWRRLRRLEDSRFIGLAGPRVLMRQPYEPMWRFRNDGFPFVEGISPEGTTLLWGNAAFAFAVVIIRNFIQSGWFADIRGVSQDREDGGIVSNLEIPAFDLGTESNGLSAQPPVEVRITVNQEQQLSEIGVIPVSTTYMSSALVFNSNQSAHIVEHYSDIYARQNARIAAMLQYVLCASRFAHYIKVIMRDEIGGLTEPRSIQTRLEDWLTSYTIGNDDADNSLRTRFPLRSAGVVVDEVPGKPGVYSCAVRLQPHFQLDDVTTSFNLVAETTAKAISPDRANNLTRMTA